MKKRSLIIVLVIVVAVFFLSLLFWQKTLPSFFQPSLKKTSNKIIVFQKIITNNNGPKFNRYTVKPSITALELLKQTVQVKTQGEGSMAFVTEINNIVANQKNKEYWAFYINGQAAMVGAGSYQLKNNDKIEWKKESY